MIRAYRGARPQLAASAHIDETALVIGNVTIGERAGVWPQASFRGNVNTITIGDAQRSGPVLRYPYILSLMNWL